MRLVELRDLRTLLRPGQRLIGIDLGSRTIGVALSDVGRRLASPVVGLPRGRLAATATALTRLAEREGAGGIIVGLPLSMDGSFGPAAQAARDWARALAEATGLPVALWDERLSTAAVNRLLIREADMSRRKRAEAVDRAAAAWILQGALDALAQEP